MADKDFLALAVANLKIKAEQVLSSKLYEDHISLVVDYGIAGAKKLILTFADLEQPDEAEAEAVKVDAVKDRLYGRQKGKR